MFERFTTPARQVVVRAQVEARQLGHNYVGTEHILLGIAGLHDTAAGRALIRQGAEVDTLRRGIVDVVGIGNPTEPDAAALDAFGIDLAAVRRRVEEIFGPGALERTSVARRHRQGRRRLLRRRRGCSLEEMDIGPARGPHVPFTPRAKKVLELSLREALALGHNYISPEHILLGLLREGEGLAAMLLHRNGVAADQLRAALLEELGRA